MTGEPADLCQRDPELIGAPLVDQPAGSHRGPVYHRRQYRGQEPRNRQQPANPRR
ncbi:Uncharacterised protein [Mycobacterium tuberculosis]|uniref:Uncharacterized protein n=1 Tax=Mycobacterium tuberculosis TaxID=1773 RepID=A0A916PHF7_MYCTX|nr:Uncharacterised protein [Mycobacterium tuberculosis]COW07317.1 Uncharacterised protein [Mycobacterium tuberculosis]CPA74991.1 Uncharacterised protein [Mycobacterium tuberculosis]